MDASRDSNVCMCDVCGARAMSMDNEALGQYDQVYKIRHKKNNRSQTRKGRTEPCLYCGQGDDVVAIVRSLPLCLSCLCVVVVGQVVDVIKEFPPRACRVLILAIIRRQGI